VFSAAADERALKGDRAKLPDDGGLAPEDRQNSLAPLR
jgi:hypothetical protein